MINRPMSEDEMPKIYGAITIGERGQVIIPAEARKDLNLSPSTKLMVLSGGQIGDGLLLLKAETVAKMIGRANRVLSNFTEVMQSETENQEK
jgi:AbrB family looped-hinge helix DNA binding protein